MNGPYNGPMNGPYFGPMNGPEEDAMPPNEEGGMKPPSGMGMPGGPAGYPGGPIAMGPGPSGMTPIGFNPISGLNPVGPGTYTNPVNPINPINPSGPTTIYPQPPPTGNGAACTTNAQCPGGSVCNAGTCGPAPTTTDPVSAGNAALFDTIKNVGLQNQLQGLLVAGLFQDGSVNMSPVDGKWHLYADAIQQNSGNGIKFLNATMVYQHTETLNYQVAAIQFNQTLPTNPSAYYIATQTAFRSDFGTTLPAYFATSVDNYRTNTVDYVDVQASLNNGHQPVLVGSGAAARYVTVFDNGSCTVNGTKLYTFTTPTTGAMAGIPSYAYLGGTKPTVSISPTTTADIAMNNTYSNGVYLGRRLTYIDTTSGQIASPSTLPSGQTAQLYLSGTMLVAQDSLYSNLFSKGSIMTFGSSQSRILGGIDSVLNNQDALSILGGTIPVGMPDGLFHS
jgi:hypothetical protein